MKRLILYLLTAFIAGLLLFRWGYHRGVASVDVKTEVRVDTIFYERPQPVRVSYSSATVRVPFILFAPADTVQNTVIVADGQESAELHVTIERQEYGGRDTSFFAVISGPSIGGLRPRLDHLELYSIERVQTKIVRKPYRWEIGPAAGAWYVPAGGGFWIGGFARKSFGRFSLSAEGGYDIHSNAAYGQVQAGMALWRKK